MGIKFTGELNTPPPCCDICGAKHEPAYPHEDTARFRINFFRRQGRAPTQYDLVAHTSGIIREAVMVAQLQKMEVR